MEAFNLKAAIEYNMNNIEQAKEALVDMPRARKLRSTVTLHNQALMNMDDDPTTGFKAKLFAAQPPSGRRLATVATLLQVLPLRPRRGRARRKHTAYVQDLSAPLYEFLDACIMVQTSLRGLPQI